MRNCRRRLLQQIDEVIAQDKAAETETVEFTPETLTSLIGELKEVLESEPEPTDKEQKKKRRGRKKQIKELEKHRDKLQVHNSEHPHPVFPPQLASFEL